MSGATATAQYRFENWTADDGLPPGQVMDFAPDLKGEPLVNMYSGRFYMRDGRFVAAPPEYQDPDVKFYLAPSGAQWTITKSGTTREVGGRVTQNPLKLNFDSSGVWPYEEGQGNLWLGDGSGLYRLRDGQVTRYTKRDGLPPRTLLRPSCEDEEGGVWFATEGRPRSPKDNRTMTSLTQKFSKLFFGAAIRVVTLTLLPVVFGASAALAHSGSGADAH